MSGESRKVDVPSDDETDVELTADMTPLTSFLGSTDELEGKCAGSGLGDVVFGEGGNESIEDVIGLFEMFYLACFLGHRLV